MIDKVGIVAENYFKYECDDLAEKEKSLVHTAYIRGFRAGVAKVRNKKQPTTNADKLRAMSDEELAEWIDEFWSAPWCPDDPPVDPETKCCLLHDGDCRLCILDWLRQGVSD